ncbi:hypothetical protein ACP70R_036259 [Stipagrostis hirtigluma subsp. patula]
MAKRVPLLKDAGTQLGLRHGAARSVDTHSETVRNRNASSVSRDEGRSVAAEAARVVGRPHCNREI